MRSPDRLGPCSGVLPTVWCGPAAVLSCSCGANIRWRGLPLAPRPPSQRPRHRPRAGWSWMDPPTSTALGLALAYLVVFLVNLAPALMPPTWSILAFFLIGYHLPLVPLAVGGALAASAGRLGLALASRPWGPRPLSPERRGPPPGPGGPA